MGITTVLITGCSEGGIGSALAEQFQARGVHVFATARSTAKMAHLENLPNVTLLPLDVTSTASIAAAVDTVKEETDGRLDVLVNNAGGVYIMPLLDTDIEYGQRVFDVNVWGPLRVVQAFAPMLIAARGCVGNICSLNGHLWAPWVGVYGASKAAQELMSETLRLEMEPFGVRVLAFVTGFVKSRAHENAPDAHLPNGSLYASLQESILLESCGGDGSAQRMEAKVYADKVIGDILGQYSGKSWRGKMASVVSWVTSYFPTFYIDRQFRAGSGINRLKTL